MQVLAGTAAAGISASFPVHALASLSLERQVNTYLKKLRRKGHIRSDERTAWSVYDFSDHKKLVSINENKPLQAASMIKPFLAQAYFFRHREDNRRFPYNKHIRKKMEAMIRHSDNRAANFFINKVGANRPASGRPLEVQRVLKRYAGGIFRQTSIVEFIPRDGRTYRNKASAHDYSRFLFAMQTDRLPYADKIKHYMGLPNRDRIEDGADVPRCVDLYHKTGSTAHVCGDMGLLVAKGRDGKHYPYIFVGIIQKEGVARDYGGWMRSRGDVIREISGMAYAYMKDRHNLVC
ncbi:MAG: serine hydrolase [Desulfoferrobacter sp.]